MMKEPIFACLDVETTGLTNDKLPADHPSQPRLAHLAMVYLDADLEVTGHDDIYVKPEGWTMPDEVFAINGLTTKFLNDYGRPIGEVLDLYARAILSGLAIVGWNIAFDLKVVRGECRRAGST
jgi:DNA polymerase-3 subunit epsilon